jgi:hypothetical protein
MALGLVRCLNSFINYVPTFRSVKTWKHVVGYVGVTALKSVNVSKSINVLKKKIVNVPKKRVSKIRLCDPHHIIVDATAILQLLVSLSIMMHLFQPSTQKMISYYYLD